MASRYRVRIDGRDISPAIDPVLIRLSVHDETGAVSDSAELELSDAAGDILLPRMRARIEIDLVDTRGRALAFAGVVDEPQHRGGRGGRVLTLRAKGMDTFGRAKEAREAHWDDATLGRVLSEAGAAAGVGEVRIDAELAAITRPYVAQQSESFLALGERLAREVGATFKVQGGTALLVRRGQGLSAGGKPLALVVAERGVNLIDWEIAPTLGRPRHRRTRVRHWDAAARRWREARREVDDAAAEAAYSAPFPAGDAAVAGSRAGSDALEVARTRGAGQVTIQGDVTAKPEAALELKGARPGIDGTYRISAVDHEYDRSQGLVTRLTLGEPSGEAGVDRRRA